MDWLFLLNPGRAAETSVSECVRHARFTWWHALERILCSWAEGHGALPLPPRPD